MHERELYAKTIMNQYNIETMEYTTNKVAGPILNQYNGKILLVFCYIKQDKRPKSMMVECLTIKNIVGILSVKSNQYLMTWADNIEYNTVL